MRPPAATNTWGRWAKNGAIPHAPAVRMTISERCQTRPLPILSGVLLLVLLQWRQIPPRRVRQTEKTS
jgi:hypothetical protein